MIRYIPPGYVLLEDAYKEIIGDECEHIDIDCKFTMKEQELIELLRKEAEWKKENKKGNVVSIPTELNTIESVKLSQADIIKSINTKFIQQKELIALCNNSIFQFEHGSGLGTKLIISDTEQFPHSIHNLSDIDCDNAFNDSRGHVVIHDETLNQEIVKRGHLVVFKANLLKISERVLEELKEYNKGINWGSKINFKKSKNYKVSGFPGRPTSWGHIVKPYFQERMKNKECETSVTNEGKHLSEWLEENHPNEPQALPRTIHNTIRAIYREYKSSLN